MWAKCVSPTGYRWVKLRRKSTARKPRGLPTEWMLFFSMPRCLRGGLIATAVRKSASARPPPPVSRPQRRIYPSVSAPVIYVTDIPAPVVLALRSLGLSFYGGLQEQPRRDALCHAPVADLRRPDAAGKRRRLPADRVRRHPLRCRRVSHPRYCRGFCCLQSLA